MSEDEKEMQAKKIAMMKYAIVVGTVWSILVIWLLGIIASK
jgi:hypothetical protein